MSSHLYMGFWQNKSDTFLLSCLYNTDVSARTEYEEKEIDPNTPIHFMVADCYGNPLTGYDISFYKQDLSYDTAYHTDQNGSFYVKRGKYALYSTESDEANLDYTYQGNNDMPHRFIAANAKKIHIILGYPKELIKENILLNQFYYYQSKKFVLSNNLLIGLDKQRNIVYRSSRPEQLVPRMVL